MLNPEIAIDFGASNIRLFLDGKGIVVNEPGMLAVDVRDEAVLASGKDARELIDRNAAVVEVRNAFTFGRIQNFPMASHIITRHIKKQAVGRISLPGAYVSAPDDLTSVDRQAITDLIVDTGIKRVYFLSESCCAALGAGVNIFTDVPVFILDIGASKTTCAMIRRGVPEIVRTLTLGGRDMDDAIIMMIKKRFGISIGHNSAEELKIATASALVPEKEIIAEVKGLNVLTCLPDKANVSSEDTSSVISGICEAIADLVTGVMSEMDDTAYSMLPQNGLIVTGGGARIDGMDRFLRRKTGLETYIPERPELCAVNGAARVFDLKDKNARAAVIRYSNR
ncbi:MAG: rod shape-determining protein [Clostridia bacterium]|nr:rod shape-determining protein [Clostridia bacterium]